MLCNLDCHDVGPRGRSIRDFRHFGVGCQETPQRRGEARLCNRLDAKGARAGCILGTRRANHMRPAWFQGSSEFPLSQTGLHAACKPNSTSCTCNSASLVWSGVCQPASQPASSQSMPSCDSTSDLEHVQPLVQSAMQSATARVKLGVTVMGFGGTVGMSTIICQPLILR